MYYNSSYPLLELTDFFLRKPTSILSSMNSRCSFFQIEQELKDTWEETQGQNLQSFTFYPHFYCVIHILFRNNLLLFFSKHEVLILIQLSFRIICFIDLCVIWLNYIITMIGISRFGNKHTWFNMHAIQQMRNMSLHEVPNVQYPVGVYFIEKN